MTVYEKKGFTSLPFIAGLISFPISLIYNFVTKNNDDLSVYSFFISIGASLGLYIGLKEHKIIREIIGG
jgi:cytosine/uracil/thiamine/allantoin permease